MARPEKPHESESQKPEAGSKSPDVPFDQITEMLDGVNFEFVDFLSSIKRKVATRMAELIRRYSMNEMQTKYFIYNVKCGLKGFPFGEESMLSKGSDPVAATSNLIELMGGLIKGDIEHFDTFVNIQSKDDEERLMRFLEYAAQAAVFAGNKNR